MSMICSTESCWSEEKDTTVGTSTNCSSICGALSTVRQQREGNEISGTSMTCSTGVCGVNEPEDVEDVHQLFPQLRHRSIQNLHQRCKLGHMLREVPPHTPLRLHLDEKCWPHPRTSPSPALVTVSWPRKASYLAPSTTLVSRFEGVVPEEWWSASARAVRTVCRSCFNHERSRRSRRRLAAPESRSPCSNMSTARATEQKTVLTHWCGRHSDRDA